MEIEISGKGSGKNEIIELAETLFRSKSEVKNVKENEISRVSQRMKELEGAYLAGVGRASSLAWFLFEKNKTEYALHLQTGFRVVTDENIIFASADIFQSSDFLENSEEFDYDTFDWDIQENSRYDERVDSFIDKYLNKLVVIGVFVSQYGDLTIKMNNGIEIEVFINMSKDECWRFFRRTFRKSSYYWRRWHYRLNIWKEGLCRQ